MEGYNLTRATRLIQEFVIDDLSNWYIRLNRSRFYGSGDDPDKYLVYLRLYEVLVGVCKLMAPIAPFFSDFVYRQLRGNTDENSPESVHLSRFPTCEDSAIDSHLEEEMALVKKIVSLALAARKRKNLKVRQPLPRLVIVADTGPKLRSEVEDIILRELNVKRVEFVDSASAFMEYKTKPVFAKLGPKFGKHVNKAAAAITGWTSEEIKTFIADKSFELAVEGQTATLEDGDVEILREEHEGYGVEAEGGVTVALETTLSPELIDEGFAREVVNKVQNMRKTSGFEVTDRIIIKLFADDPLAAAVSRFRDHICTETLADSLEQSELDAVDGTPQATEWSINGQKAVIAVDRV